MSKTSRHSQLYLCGMMKSWLLCLWTCVLLSVVANAQQKSNQGKEFWLGYGHNVLFDVGSGGPPNSQNLAIYISAEQAAQVTVSVRGTSFSQTVSIPANSVDATILIPKSGLEDARIQSEGLHERSIHIVSDVPIVAYAHQYGVTSSAATMLMPVETFGYTYYSLNFSQTTNFGIAYSWFFVVASEDNTRLEITPSDTTVLGWEPGNTYTVNLNKGQLYNVFGKRNGTGNTGKDLTGSKIVSITGSDGKCHPVGVFSGSSRNILFNALCSVTYPNGTTGNGNGGEILMQQIFPANAWGTKYVTYHTISNMVSDIQTPFLNLYRVAVRNPQTIVKRNGQVLTDLQRGFYYEFGDSTGSVIESDQPILVAQYPVNSRQCVGTQDNPLGDPEMIYLSPIEQGVKKANLFNARKEGIDISMINIIVPTTALSTLLIDGTPALPSEYLAHPTNPLYTVVARRYFGPPAFHTLRCDTPFVATVYGIGAFESYGYNAGTLVNNLNAYTQFKNELGTAVADTLTCINTPFQVQLKLAYRATQIHWRISEAGGGISPGTDITETAPLPVDSTFIQGRRYYTYSLPQSFRFMQTGQFRIPVTYSAPDLDACNQTETIFIEVQVGNGPKANFDVVGKGCVGETMSFNGTPLTNGFTLSSYLWKFSDNTTANTLNTQKSFPSAGVQPVQLRVIASNGCTHDTLKAVAIDAIPSVQYQARAAQFCAGKPIQFIASTTGVVQQWNWDFGVATSNQRPPLTQVFPQAGLYQTSLTVSSPNGCLSAPATLPVEIGTIPQVSAGADQVIKKGSSTQLLGNIANGNGYLIQWSPSSQLSNPTILQPIASPTSTTWYTLRATDPVQQCSALDSMQVVVLTQLAIPNSFTPNRDGNNDVWMLPGIDLYPNARVSIYNRWGQLIYATSQYSRNPWDGTKNGLLQPDGLYVYFIELNNPERETLKGHLMLLK